MHLQMPNNGSRRHLYVMYPNEKWTKQYTFIVTVDSILNNEITVFIQK